MLARPTAFSDAPFVSPGSHQRVRNSFVFHPVTCLWIINTDSPLFVSVVCMPARHQPCALLSHYPILVAWVFTSEYRTKNLLLASGCPLFSLPGRFTPAVIMTIRKSTRHSTGHFFSVVSSGASTPRSPIHTSPHLLIKDLYFWNTRGFFCRAMVQPRNNIETLISLYRFLLYLSLILERGQIFCLLFIFSLLKMILHHYIHFKARRLCCRS